MTSRLLAGLALAGALMFTHANAVVVSGNVTGGNSGGSFVELDGTSTFTVGNDNQQSNDLFAFDEDQNILLANDLFYDIDSANLAGSIAAGTVVASHYVFFDPGPTRSIIGSVTFDSDILGVATSTGLLSASDFLVNSNVTYLNPGLRGLESGDTVTVSGSTLSLNWTASTPGDYVRVFTERSPTAAIPLPAPAFLLLSALGAMVLVRRRAA